MAELARTTLATQPLAAAELSLLGAYIHSLVEAMVSRRQPAVLLPASLARREVMGMSLALHRPRLVRSQTIKYHLPRAGTPQHTIGYLAGYLASSVAGGGVDQPGLRADELPYLEMRLGVMHHPQLVAGQGEEQLRFIQPAEHGLVVLHPGGQGVVLPEDEPTHYDDPPRFLSSAMSAVGLGPDAWRRTAGVKLVTFHTQSWTRPADLPELEWLSMTGCRVAELTQRISLAMEGKLGAGDASGDAVLDRIHPLLLAMGARTQQGRWAWAGGKGRTMASLSQRVGARLSPASSATDPITQVTLYWQPVVLHPTDSDRRLKAVPADAYYVDTPRGDVLVTTAGDIAIALGQAGVTMQAWRAGQVTLTAMVGMTHTIRRKRRG